MERSGLTTHFITLPGLLLQLQKAIVTTISIIDPCHLQKYSHTVDNPPLKVAENPVVYDAQHQPPIPYRSTHPWKTFPDSTISKAERVQKMPVIEANELESRRQMKDLFDNHSSQGEPRLYPKSIPEIYER